MTNAQLNRFILLMTIGFICVQPILMIYDAIRFRSGAGFFYGLLCLMGLVALRYFLGRSKV